MDSSEFARWFRAASAYIREHRFKTFIVVLNSTVLRSPQLTNLVQDLALLNVLEVRVLLLLELERTPDDGIVTQSELLANIDAARTVVHRLETLFNVGVPASRFRHRHIPIVSGNFVSARPLGVIMGVDRDFAGSVRRIHDGEVMRLLEMGTIVAIPPFGHSTTGKTYQLQPQELILAFSKSLKPSKVVVFHTPDFTVADFPEDNTDLTTSQLAAHIDDTNPPAHIREWLETLAACCGGGVARCHVVSYRDDGALLQELFTTEGSGVQISDGPYRLIRRATAEDVTSIVELLRPLEREGVLVSRNRNLLLASIDSFWVAELDDTIVGSVCLYGMHDGIQEIGSLATAPGQRNLRLGHELLNRAETDARQRGAHSTMVRTTQATDWFIENGYVDTEVTEIPTSAQRGHDRTRSPKLLIKSLK